MLSRARHPAIGRIVDSGARVPHHAPIHDQPCQLDQEYDLASGKHGQIVAADRLNLEVPDGEIFGLVGPNGAGKTTTLKMICGLHADVGQVTVNGVDVQHEPEKAQTFGLPG